MRDPKTFSTMQKLSSIDKRLQYYCISQEEEIVILKTLLSLREKPEVISFA